MREGEGYLDIRRQRVRIESSVICHLGRIIIIGESNDDQRRGNKAHFYLYEAERKVTFDVGWFSSRVDESWISAVRSLAVDRRRGAVSKSYLRIVRDSCHLGHVS